VIAVLEILFILVFAGVATAARGEDLRFAPQVPMPATFTFKPAVEVQGDRLMLGELADCTGVDVICAEAYGVDLGAAPAPGKVLILTEARLTEMLAREWDAAAIEVKAPAGLRVSAAFAEVTPEFLQGELERALAEEFPESALYHVEVSRVMLTGKHKLRPAAHKTIFPALAGAAARNEDWLVKSLNGPQRLDVRYVPESEPDAFETHPLNATFTLKKRLPVAARNLDRGAVVRAEDLGEEYVELGHGSQRFATAAKDIVGRRLRRQLAIGAPVPPGMLEVPVVVRMGQTLKLTVNAGSLRVVSHVKALGNGSYGQAIDAVSLTTKKRMRVKVVDSTTVDYLE
jgi:flagella basal body P-ring formation protein FlgA